MAQHAEEPPTGGAIAGQLQNCFNSIAALYNRLRRVNARLQAAENRNGGCSATGDKQHVRLFSAVGNDLNAAREQLQNLQDSEEEQASRRRATEELLRKNLQDLHRKYEGEISWLKAENEYLRNRSDVRPSARAAQDVRQRPPRPARTRTMQSNDARDRDITNTTGGAVPLEELTAQVMIEEGEDDFLNEQYASAGKKFREASNLLKELPQQALETLRFHELQYYIAASTALNPDTDLEEKREQLDRFLANYADAQHVDDIKLGHAKILRVQIFMNQDDIESACKLCNEAHEHLSTLDGDDYRRWEPLALWARIAQIQQKTSGLASSLTNRIPQQWRKWLQLKYTHVGPEGSEEPNATQLRAERPPGIRRVATFTLPPIKQKVVATFAKLGIDRRDSVQSTTENMPVHPEYAKRQKWLQKLGLATAVPEFTEAIVNSDLEKVQSLSDQGPIPPKSLHLAALFGEVEIARLLLELGNDVSEVCETRKLSQNSHLAQWVTPMHLAIGARGCDMIRLLGEYKANIGRPPPPFHNETAAPRWLLSYDFLKLVGCRDAGEIIQVINVLQRLPHPRDPARCWNVNVPLHEIRKTMIDYARGGLERYNKKMSKAVVVYLQSCPAR